MLTSNYETDPYWAKEVLENQLTEDETAARLKKYLSYFDSANTNRTVYLLQSPCFVLMRAIL